MSENGKTLLQIQLTQRYKDGLKQLAIRQGETLSGIVRSALRKELKAAGVWDAPEANSQEATKEVA